MKSILTSGLKLFLICAVSALTLGGINAVTEPAIAERKIQELKAALQALTPDAQAGEAESVDGWVQIKTFYPVLKEGSAAGAILELNGSGYGGDMKILARFTADGAIQAVTLMDNLETPGLGKKAESADYMDKFIATGPSDRPVPVRKNMLASGEADAITGATVTFLGVAKALAEGAQYIREGAK